MVQLLANWKSTLGFAHRYAWVMAGVYTGAQVAFHGGDQYMKAQYGEHEMYCMKSALADGTKWQVQIDGLDPEWEAAKAKHEAKKEAQIEAE